MDKERRRKLKAEGKRLVEENSKRVERELFERNPFHIGDPRWAKNVLSEYQINRTYRKNTEKVIPESEALGNAEIRDLGFDFEAGLVRRKGWYIQCTRCRELVPVACVEDLICSCRSVWISPSKRSYSIQGGHYRVVELVGRGPIRPSRPWWAPLWFG